MAQKLLNPSRSLLIANAIRSALNEIVIEARLHCSDLSFGYRVVAVRQPTHRAAVSCGP